MLPLLAGSLQAARTASAGKTVAATRLRLEVLLHHRLLQRGADGSAQRAGQPALNACPGSERSRPSAGHLTPCMASPATCCRAPSGPLWQTNARPPGPPTATHHNGDHDAVLTPHVAAHGVGCKRRAAGDRARRRPQRGVAHILGQLTHSDCRPPGRQQAALHSPLPTATPPPTVAADAGLGLPARGPQVHPVDGGVLDRDAEVLVQPGGRGGRAGRQWTHSAPHESCWLRGRLNSCNAM